MYKLFQSKVPIFWNSNTQDFPHFNLGEDYFNWEEVPTNNINFITWDTGEIVVKDRTITCFKLQKGNNYTMWLVKRVKNVLKEGFILELEIDVYNTYTRWFLQTNPNLLMDRCSLTGKILDNDYTIRKLSKQDPTIDDLELSYSGKQNKTKLVKNYTITTKQLVYFTWPGFNKPEYNVVNITNIHYNTEYAKLDLVLCLGEKGGISLAYPSHVGDPPSFEGVPNSLTSSYLINTVAGVPSSNTMYKEGNYIGTYILPPIAQQIIETYEAKTTYPIDNRSYNLFVFSLSINNRTSTQAFTELENDYGINKGLTNIYLINWLVKTHNLVLSGTYMDKIKTVIPIIKYGGMLVFNDGFIIYPNHFNYSSDDGILFSGRLPNVSSTYAEELKIFRENATMGWTSFGLNAFSSLLQTASGFGTFFTLGNHFTKKTGKLKVESKRKLIGESVEATGQSSNFITQAITQGINNNLQYSRIAGSYDNTSTNFQFNYYRYKNENITTPIEFINEVDYHYFRSINYPMYSSSIIFTLSPQSEKLLKNQYYLYGIQYDNYVYINDLIYNEDTTIPIYFKVNESWIQQCYSSLFQNNNWTLEEQEAVAEQLANGLRIWHIGKKPDYPIN